MRTEISAQLITKEFVPSREKLSRQRERYVGRWRRPLTQSGHQNTGKLVDPVFRSSVVIQGGCAGSEVVAVAISAVLTLNTTWESWAVLGK